MKNYVVPPWVRVRREEFGLLFYDTRDTKLTFVRSGSSLAAPSFTGRERRLEVGRMDERRERAVGRLLEKLEAKGLVVAVEPE
ncbi:MAG: mycofactocin biosynthesis chaperone MftB [Thermoleophilia bacterium]|jgi:putative mycofactocin binding protein MftB|nr:mycofactocin biosynthesis chaperone MftB [Thermoleophilia bacterium]